MRREVLKRFSWNNHTSRRFFNITKMKQKKYIGIFIMLCFIGELFAQTPNNSFQEAL